jgi:hypothetical protein
LIKKKHANKIVVRKSEGKRRLARSRHIKIYIAEVRCEVVNWIHLHDNRISDRLFQHKNESFGSINGGRFDHQESIL